MKLRFYELNHTHIKQVLAIESVTHKSPWTEKVIASSFGSRTANYGLFYQDNGLDQLIGYVFTDLIAGELNIENVCVDSQFQGKGYASRLLTELFSILADRLACAVLEVRASNSPAISLYQKFGFEICGTRKAYYSIPNSDEKEDALVMRKEF